MADGMTPAAARAALADLIGHDDPHGTLTSVVVPLDVARALLKADDDDIDAPGRRLRALELAIDYAARVGSTEGPADLAPGFEAYLNGTAPAPS